MDAERAFSRRLGGSCQSPIAALRRACAADRLTLEGLVAEPDGSRLLRDSISEPRDARKSWALRLAERVLAAGAGALLERLRSVDRMPLQRCRRPGHSARAAGHAAVPAAGDSGRGTFRLPAIDINRSAILPSIGGAAWAALAIFDSDHFHQRECRAIRRGAARGKKRDLTSRGHRPRHRARARIKRVTASPCSRPAVSTPRALLAHPALHSCGGPARALVKGKPRAGVAGTGTQRRGAQVIAAEVYERELRHKPHRPPLAALAAHFAARAMHVITATSVEIADHLLDLATPAAASGIRTRALAGAERAGCRTCWRRSSRWRANASGA
jgi:hypothetical protein